MVPGRLTGSHMQMESLPWGGGGWGHLRDQEPAGLLGHPQAQGQADDQIQDQQQQIGQPPMRWGGEKQNIGVTTD